MTSQTCRQCKNLFVPKLHYAERFCSDECRAASEYERSLRSRAREGKKWRAKADAVAQLVTQKVDPETLKLGDKIVFGQNAGKIIMILHPGTTIQQGWNDYCSLNPEFYSCPTSIMPTGMLQSTRYLVAVDKNGKTKVYWPYLYSIKGIVDEQEESREEN